MWLIIKPDNINELREMGYSRLPKEFVLRAGPMNGLLQSSPFGDSISDWRQRYLVDPPNYRTCDKSGASDDSRFIRDLLEAYTSYNSDLPYDGAAGDRSFPYNFLEFMGGLSELQSGVEYYNSNSFISGLLRAAGIPANNIPNPWGLQPGLDKPIPFAR